METITIIPNRTNHLKNQESDCSPQATSKEGQLAYCMRILEWIAMLQDKRHTIRECCREMYGTNHEGRIYNPDPKVLGQYENHLIAIKRLQAYYNYKVSKLSVYDLGKKPIIQNLGLPGVAENILDWTKQVVQTMRDTHLRNDAIIPYIKEKTGWTSEQAFKWLDYLMETRQIH